MNLYSIETGLFKLDGGAMFGVVPKTIWNKTNPADENNLCDLAMRSLLIEDGNRLILIDTGIGNKQSEKFFSYYYLHGVDSLEKSLASKGFSKDDITDVFLTHLHLDHVGGSIERNGDYMQATFKNAKYWSNKKHWDWAMNPNVREKASFLKENLQPLLDSGQLHFLQKEENIFISDFSIHYMHGHTEAMMLPELTYKNRSIIFVADLIPTAGHIPVPYVAGYDVFPLTSMIEKSEFLKQAIDKNSILFLEHDSVNECVTLKQTEKGIRMDKSLKISEL